jgi:hypothetical protein
MRIRTSVPAVVTLLAVATFTVTFAACGDPESVDAESTGQLTEMNGAFWAAPVAPHLSTLATTEMNGAFWAAS